MKSFWSGCFTVAFLIYSIGAKAQDETDETEKIDLSAIRWLSGKWEGSGYADPYFDLVTNSLNKSISQNFELSIQCSPDSISILLTGKSQKGTPKVYLHESQSDVSSIDERFEKRIRLLYLNPYREGGRGNDRELLIYWVNENHINLSLTYYARPKENLILHGAFRRVKNP